MAGEIAGTAAGMAAGAAAGAAIGAAFGGVGAIPGAVIGAIVGIAGGIAGGVAGHAITNAALSDSRSTDDRRTREVAVAMSSGKIKNASDKDEIAEWLKEQYHLTASEAERQAVELANSSDELIKFGREIEETEATLNSYH
jgi:phage tail tape-measure protein